MESLEKLEKRKKAIESQIQEFKQKDIKDRQRLKDDVSLLLGQYLIAYCDKHWWEINWTKVAELLNSCRSEILGLDKNKEFAVVVYRQIKKMKSSLGKDQKNKQSLNKDVSIQKEEEEIKEVKGNVENILSEEYTNSYLD